MKILVVILAGLMLLTGCETEQNPIKGAPDTIVNGTPPEMSKPTPEEPFKKEALQIDFPTDLRGRVGSSLEFKITGRVLVEGIEHDVIIENLGDFPGATYDPATGDFKWVPTKSKIGSFNSIDLVLSVLLVTRPTDKYPNVMGERANVKMTIENSYSRPIINMVTKPTGSITVGGTYNFIATIEDMDAMSAADVTVVLNECTKGYYSESATYMAKPATPEVVPNAPGKFTVKVPVDLGKANKTSGATYCFGLRAISKQGVDSAPYDVEFSVDGRMPNTKITTETFNELTVGQKMFISFQIHDATEIGTLTLIKFDDLSKMIPGSSLTCNRSFASKWRLDCTGLIDATAATPGNYALGFTVENTGSYRMVKSTTNHTIRFVVKAATP